MEIYKNIPNAYLWILPNSGHSTPIVYANEFNTKVDAFFKQPYRKFDSGKKILLIRMIRAKALEVHNR